jgi:hypothetical protein
MLRTAITNIATVVLVALIGTPVEAQDVDFSGTWILDRDSSDIPQRRGRGSRGRRGGNGGDRQGGIGGGGPVTVTITQTDEAVVMEQQVAGRSQTVTYRLDGGPSENSGPRGGMATTTSFWDDAALVTEGSQTVSPPRGELTLESYERRTLSDGGQTMTITTTWTTPRGDVTATLVYRKPTG